jgi:hypothetical protein
MGITTLLGLNILLVIFVWKCMIKKTILDHYRDKLFDLRKEVRDHFVAHEIPLSCDTYKNLYDLLNAHLRFTEDITFSKFIFLESELKNNDSLKEFLKNQLDSKFKTSDEQLDAFVKDIRRRSISVLTDYMICFSGITWFIAVLMMLFYIPYKLAESLVLFTMKLISNGVDTFSQVLRGLNLLFEDIISVNTQVFSRTIRKDILEEYSYKYSMNNMQPA